MIFLLIKRIWLKKKIKNVILASLLTLFANTFISASSAGENGAGNGSDQPPTKKIRLNTNPDIQITCVSEDPTFNPEEYAWMQRITCIKQEPPDDESEAGSLDSGFTTSSETQSSPSVFQTIESGNSGFQCPQCKKYYKTAASLNAHVSQHHSGERTCNQCQPPIILKSAQALANHNRSHHSGERHL